MQFKCHFCVAKHNSVGIFKNFHRDNSLWWHNYRQIFIYQSVLEKRNKNSSNSYEVCLAVDHKQKYSMHPWMFLSTVKCKFELTYGFANVFECCANAITACHFRRNRASISPSRRSLWSYTCRRRRPGFDTTSGDWWRHSRSKTSSCCSF